MKGSTVVPVHSSHCSAHVTVPGTTSIRTMPEAAGIPVEEGRCCVCSGLHMTQIYGVESTSYNCPHLNPWSTRSSR